MSRLLIITCILALLLVSVDHAYAGAKAIPSPNMVPQLHKDQYTGFTESKAPTPSNIPPNYNWCATATGCSPQPQQLTPSYSSLSALHTTVLMLNDRLRAKTQGLGIPDIQLSRQDYLDHAHNYGFGLDQTGHMQGVDVLEYAKRHGLPDETCNPYTGALSTRSADPTQRCFNCLKIHQDKEPHCWFLPQFVKYYVSEYGFVRGADEMQAEILHAGPIQCSIAMDDEFLLNYRGGVYNDNGRLKKSPVDSHVEVVGWGESIVPRQDNPDLNQVKQFWIVRSSLGTNALGIQGFFLVERGVNAMRIEEQCTFARVDTSELLTHLNGQTIGSIFGLISPTADPQQYPQDWDSFTHSFKSSDELKQRFKENKQIEKWIQKNDPNAIKPSKLVTSSADDEKDTITARAGIISDSLVSTHGPGGGSAAATPKTALDSSHPDTTSTSDSAPDKAGAVGDLQYEEARIIPKRFRLRRIIKYLTMIAFIVFTIAFTFAVYTWYTKNTIPSDYEPIPTARDDIV